MATHSSVLAWRIPGMGEPGGLPSMGSHRVGHDWSFCGGGSGFTIWTTRKALTSSLEVNKGWNWLDFWNPSHPGYSPQPSSNNWVRQEEGSGPALGGWAEMGSLNQGARSEPFPGQYHLPTCRDVKRTWHRRWTEWTFWQEPKSKLCGKF